MSSIFAILMIMRDEKLTFTLVSQLYGVSKAIQSYSEEVLGKLHVLESFGEILMVLDPMRGPIPMRELVSQLNCDPSNLTLIADKLERAELALRQPHPVDGRIKQISLTPKGVALRTELIQGFIHNSPLATLTKQESIQLSKLLSKI
jgi:DNA-binding MarR family transcriptional regulator